MNRYVCVICGKTFDSYQPKKTCSRECHKALAAKNLEKRRAKGERFFCAKNDMKKWILISPEGEEVEVLKLYPWAKENAELFGKERTAKSAYQIVSAFSQIGSSMRGSLNSRPVRSYHGWTIKEPPFKQGGDAP